MQYVYEYHYGYTLPSEYHYRYTLPSEYHYGYTLPSEYHYTTTNRLYIAYILPVGIFDVPVNYGIYIYI